MALSNAERQARFQKRLRERAANPEGITPEMVAEVVEILYRWACNQRGEVADWPGFLRVCKGRRGRAIWTAFVPDDVRPDAYDWIDDPAQRRKVEKVAAVTHAIRNAPRGAA